MSDYTQITDFSAKDNLSSGDPEKLILGSDVDGEFSAIATAISSKYDSADLASQAQAEAETDNTVLLTPLRLAQWADANGGMVGDLQAKADPNADQLIGWDDSAGALIGFTFSGSGIAFGDGVVAVEAGLEAIAGLAKTDGNIIVGNGSTWVAESGATARTSLGLGSIATQASSSVTITGGSITGITDLTIADGGTGASTAAGALSNLGIGPFATNDEALQGGATTIVTPANLHSNYVYMAGFATSTTSASFSAINWYRNDDTFDADFYLPEGKYIIEGVIVNGCANGTPDLKLQIAQGTDATAAIDVCVTSFRSWSGYDKTMTDIGYVSDATLPHSIGTVITQNAGNTDGYQCSFQTFIRVTTGGEFQLQYGCVTAGVATQILYGTYLKITRCDTSVP